MPIASFIYITLDSSNFMVTLWKRFWKSAFTVAQQQFSFAVLNVLRFMMNKCGYDMIWNWKTQRHGQRNNGDRLLCRQAARFILHCEPKKGGSAFDVITLENTLNCYNFCIAVSRKKHFTHPSTLLCKNETITFHTYNALIVYDSLHQALCEA